MMLTQEEIEALLKQRICHAPAHKVIRLRDFQMPDKVQPQDEMAPMKKVVASMNALEKCQYKPVP